MFPLLAKIPGGYEDKDENRAKAAEEVAVYLWENYIEYAQLLAFRPI
jgi:hypothetical protein